MSSTDENATVDPDWVTFEQVRARSPWVRQGYCHHTTQCGTGSWHTQPIGSAWRLRDKLARALQFHCWDCWRH